MAMLQAIIDHINLLTALDAMYDAQMKAEQWDQAYCTYVAILDECKRTTKHLEEGGLRQTLQTGVVNRALASAKEIVEKKSKKK